MFFVFFEPIYDFCRSSPVLVDVDCVCVQTENNAAILWGSGVGILKVIHDENACVQLLDEWVVILARVFVFFGIADVLIFTYPGRILSRWRGNTIVFSVSSPSYSVVVHAYSTIMLATAQVGACNGYWSRRVLPPVAFSCHYAQCWDCRSEHRCAS